MPRSRRQKPKRGSRRATSSGSIPALETLAPAMIKNPAGFLSLPRELRDQVYAYLLATEYTRLEFRVGHDRCDYVYRFCTSILYTNRQVSYEAYQAFYMNNLLVHISLSRDQREWFVLGRIRTMLQSKHYAMKIYLSTAGENPRDHEQANYTITNNELPGLCQNLLWAENRSPGRLASTKLRLAIGDEVGTGGAKAKEDISVESHKENTIGTTSSRVRKLLEPFRRLHSINDLQIIGPLSGKYKAEVIADMSRPLPSIEDLFNYGRISHEKAIGKFDSGDFASSIIEFQNTIDEVDDAVLHRDIQLSQTDFILRPYEITTGPYAGYNLCDARLAVRLTVWTKLAWACLKIGDIHSAESWLVQIFTLYSYPSSYPRTPVGGDDAIMISDMVSQIREERSRVGNDMCTYISLPSLPELPPPLASLLRESLRHEPEIGCLHRN